MVTPSLPPRPLPRAKPSSASPALAPRTKSLKPTGCHHCITCMPAEATKQLADSIAKKNRGDLSGFVGIPKYPPTIVYPTDPPLAANRLWTRRWKAVQEKARRMRNDRIDSLCYYTAEQRDARLAELKKQEKADMDQLDSQYRREYHELAHLYNSTVDDRRAAMCPSKRKAELHTDALEAYRAAQDGLTKMHAARKEVRRFAAKCALESLKAVPVLPNMRKHLQKLKIPPLSRSVERMGCEPIGHVDVDRKKWHRMLWHGA